MILVTVSNSSLGYLFEMQGHAEEAESEMECKKVCAGASTLAVTLWNLVGSPGGDAAWEEGGGHVKFEVRYAYIEGLKFVLRGLELIAKAYPGNVRIIAPAWLLPVEA